jgi:hypothetical protein
VYLRLRIVPLPPYLENTDSKRVAETPAKEQKSASDREEINPSIHEEDRNYRPIRCFSRSACCLLTSHHICRIPFPLMSKPNNKSAKQAERQENPCFPSNPGHYPKTKKAIAYSVNLFMPADKEQVNRVFMMFQRLKQRKHWLQAADHLEENFPSVNIPHWWLKDFGVLLRCLVSRTQSVSGWTMVSVRM